MSDNSVLKPEPASWEENTIEFKPVERIGSSESAQTQIYSHEDYVRRTEIQKGFEAILNNPECPESVADAINVVINFLPTVKGINAINNAEWIKESFEEEEPARLLPLFKKRPKKVRGYRCSHCGISRKVPMNYCPNCGSKCQVGES